MKKLTGNEIRNVWLTFFKERGHKVESGVSLIPYKDPTLLWINSGVAGLKKFFDGSEIPSSRRITNVQKSIRTNDIENVGYTARHHTFFEMLGNFSIGDYFRDEMLPWAFEILTSNQYFGMPKDNLYFTYLPTDLTTKRLWLKCGVAADHLIPLEDNFWQIGEGPCGPNTEVFFDRGSAYDPHGKGVELLAQNIENDRYIEIWGIVFSQYNAVEGVKREDFKELPSKNIDTGAGLERIACVLQETPTNFETDLFYPLIEKTVALAKEPYSGSFLTAYRVIADHIRTVVFALADGEPFSNEGRGYVLRRVLRRAMRFGRKIGIEKPFLSTLVPTVVSMMKDFYPNLINRQDYVAKSVKAEEEKFLKTLKTGETMLRQMLNQKRIITGEEAFRLYDTFGFPVELTIEIANESSAKVDVEGFNLEMKKQKERARQARVDASSMNQQHHDLLNFKEASTFVYDDKNHKALVIALFAGGNRVEELNGEGEIVLDTTNFYAESGGQIGDQGRLYSRDFEARVLNTHKAPNKQHLHEINVIYGAVRVGDELHIEIDHQRRHLTMRNHSATHLLHSALVEVLGSHISQQGSYVSDEYLRFDFSHYEKISSAQLLLIEKRVNELIAAGIDASVRVLPIKEAEKTGAKAFFSEKYGEEVRVVSFGDASREFCGGTHVRNTEEIGVFVIESEESIAAGVRRIQARSSIGAYELLKKREALLHNVEQIVGANSIFEVGDRLKALLADGDLLKAENARLSDRIAAVTAEALRDAFATFNGYRVIVKYLAGFKREMLTKIGDQLKVVHPDYVIVLAGGEDGDIALVSFVGGQALKDGVKAGAIIRDLASHLNGSGGGRPEMAQGQGKKLDQLNKAFEVLKESLK
ncbi:MAG: alanine--tRNA ligase [Bacilli bacterium]|jgi:alanyl-tRNA synthetase